MRFPAICAALVLAACASAAAQAPSAPAQPAQPPSLQDILDHAPASDWRPLDPENTLYMELPTGRVIIELSPDFSPEHAANVRALARAHYWDVGAITRVQDNYVTQWGRAEGDTHDRGTARADIPTPEYDRSDRGLPFTRLPDPDSYSAQTGFSNGFWAARDGAGKTWMPHCYGAIGVGRDNPPNTGDGSELYVVIGQAPRHLDRNLAMVGRVVQGMELLSGLKRGTGPLGFYQTAAERTPINSIRLASDVPEAQRTNLEALRTDSATFRTVIDSRRFRRESFFATPTGHINVCNVPLPVRAMPAH
jgi:peptidylprolyl isomerase